MRWPLDSIRFAMKAEEGTNSPIRIQFESKGDPAGSRGTLVDFVADDQWHEYTIALSEFFQTSDDKPNWDSTQISVVQFMGEANATAGKKIYFDYMWTGNPEIDVIAPVAPAGPIAVGGDYVNLITWIDIPGENGVVYNVLYSENPITSIDDEGVGIVEMNINSGIQLATHVLTSPMVDTELAYYYAVYAVDAAGNIGELAPIEAVTNTARGITSVYSQAPTGFAIDGDLSEWNGIASYRMYPEDGSGSVVTNTSIDNNTDLSVDAYVAIDDNYLYVAFNVEDDIIDVDSTDGETWMRDAPDLFIGFYDLQGAPHTGYERGEEPDYHFRFSPHQLLLDISGGGVLEKQGPNYIWQEKFPSGYVVEAKISLDTLAVRGGDQRFHPEVGMKLPIDYSINDADGSRREGILTYSPKNEDKSWADVSRWFHSWIGDKMTDVDESGVLPETYSLDQNYPNPFNPSTVISYSVVNKGNVSLKVFNVLGQEVASLVNKVQAPGKYQVSFNAADLATGMYIYQIQAGSFVSSKKMMLIK